MELEFYFDLGSPTAYLAYRRLVQLGERYAFTLTHRPMLLGGVFKATGNMSPVAIPAKGKYMLEQDLPRFAKRYAIPLIFNPYFPINTLQLMRGVFAARALGCEDVYLNAVFEAIWMQEKDMGDAEVVSATLNSAGLDADGILHKSQEPCVKQQLIDATEAAVARGVFGAPTIILSEEMFFGQDRLDFVEERLKEKSAV